MAYSPSSPLTAGTGTVGVALRDFDRRLEQAQCALATVESAGQRREAATSLYEVEIRLSELATVLPDTAMAQQLIALRDLLSSHLLAASTCERGELPTSVVVGLLRRGADRARRGIRQTVTADGDQAVPAQFADV